jgi:CheY-specific phosphatase CheX
MAIELQDSINLKLGETALAIEMVTQDDVKRIHDAQRGEDLMFGDMAVKLGILNQVQLREILKHQQKNHLRLGEALVRVSAFSDQQLQVYLEDFRTDQSRYKTEQTPIPSGIPTPKVWNICADLSAKMFMRVIGIQCQVGECLLVDRAPGGAVVAGIDLAGDVSARYLLGVSAQLREAIAKALLLEEDVTRESEEVLDDTVLEFVNIICGNVAAKAAQEGTAVDIKPPFALHPGAEGIPVPPDSYGLLFQLATATGDRAEVTLFVRR